MIASVHSKLRMPFAPMTERMLAVIGYGILTCSASAPAAAHGLRPPAVAVRRRGGVQACRDRGVAVEINCRPERRDPPDDLLRLAVGIGCVWADRHRRAAPGRLDWLDGGCSRAELFDIAPDRVINTRGASAMTSSARKGAPELLHAMHPGG